MYTRCGPEGSAAASALVSPATGVSAARQGGCGPQQGGEGFVLELQRRRGCCATFRYSYDRLIAHLGTRNLLPRECVASSRLRALYSAAAALPPLPSLPQQAAPFATLDGVSPASPYTPAGPLRATSSGGDASFPPPPPPAGVVALQEATRDVAALLASSSFGAPPLSPSLSASRESAYAGVVSPSAGAPSHPHGCSPCGFGSGEEGEEDVVEDRGYSAQQQQQGGASSSGASSTSGPIYVAAGAAGASASASSSVVVSVPEAHGVVAALASLVEVLASEFDDVALPAAQSLALLSGSDRVRAALGAVIRAYLDAHRARAAGGASPASARAATSLAAAQAFGAPAESPAAALRSPSAGSVASPSHVVGPGAAAAAAAVERDGLLAVNLLGLLMRRASDVLASVECRTAAAFAVANFARHAAVADALMMFRAPLTLLDAAAGTEICARNACLRRQLLRGLWHVISTSPAHARVALQLDCCRRAEVLASSPHHTGIEPGFDALIARVAQRLADEQRAVVATAGASTLARAAASPAAHAAVAATAVAVATGAAVRESSLGGGSVENDLN